MLPLLLFLFGLEARAVIGLPQSGLSLPTQGFSLEHHDTPRTTEAPPQLPKPEMYSLRVESQIKFRYAKTVVSSRLANPANKSQEVFFSVVLPETAFISGFLMEVEGKVYEAYVREKEEAKHEYEQAVSSGQAAAHVAVSARDSNHFTVSVNVEPQKKATFNLTYEELLTRRLGLYNHVINLRPGQEVRDLQVQVFISESRNITALQVPELRSGNEIDPDQDKKVNSLAKIERPSATEAQILFSPSVEEQRELAKKFADVKQQAGLNGQFIVQYDVDRDPQAGEVLVNDGYFVHFFAPTNLKPLPKHVVFVLDVSGSMNGRKIEQLKEAMQAILDDLNDGDYFNIIEFSYSVTVWNLDSTSQSAVFAPYNSYGDSSELQLSHTPAFPATEEYKAKAKDIIKKMRASGGTNIDDTLRTAIRVAHDGLQNVTIKEKPEPIIIFLTDGEPTVGEVQPNKIQATVKELNFDPEVSIFSLALGDDADLTFLNRLSLRNSGFARKIYEASDTALQLRDFYLQVASPLLANVTFKYQPEHVQEESITEHNFPMLFLGREFIVAGKLKENVSPHSLSGQVSGSSLDGASVFSSTGVAKDHSSLERLWAYLTIQQLIEKYELQKEDDANLTDSKDSKGKALGLALKYSFVTPLTSLVVVKPNSTRTVNSEAVQPEVNDGGPHYALPLAASFPAAPTLTGPYGAGGMANRVGISGAGFPSLHKPLALYNGFGNTHGVTYDTKAESQPQTEHEVAVDQVAETSTYLTTRLGDTTLAVTTKINKELDELLDSINDLEWLSKVVNGSDTLVLPLGENGTAVIFTLGINETAVGGATCETSAYPEGGVCVPLPQCVLRVFKQDLDIYLKQYFCKSGSLAGVCCPSHLYSQKRVTTEKTHDSTTVVE